jgi:hypothetical protein
MAAIAGQSPAPFKSTTRPAHALEVTPKRRGVPFIEGLLEVGSVILTDENIDAVRASIKPFDQ